MLKKIKNNKKGFSLIELIIVIAIMVALIAVMAPSFVKYVQKSRDTALTTAAEDYYSAVKVFYGDPDFEGTIPTGSITLSVNGGKLKIDADDTIEDIDDINTAAGVDTNKKMGATTKTATISIANNNGEPSFSMTVSS